MKNQPADLKSYLQMIQRLEVIVKVTAMKPGEGLLSVRQLARKMRVRQQVIIHAVEDSDYLALAVGVGCNGGVAAFTRTGDYCVEYYGEL